METEQGMWVKLKRLLSVEHFLTTVISRYLGRQLGLLRKMADSLGCGKVRTDDDGFGQSCAIEILWKMPQIFQLRLQTTPVGQRAGTPRISVQFPLGTVLGHSIRLHTLNIPLLCTPESSDTNVFYYFFTQYIWSYYFHPPTPPRSSLPPYPPKFLFFHSFSITKIKIDSNIIFQMTSVLNPLKVSN